VLSVQSEPEYALAINNNNGGAILYTFFPAKSIVVVSFMAVEAGLTAETSVIGAQFFSEPRMKELLTSAVPAEWIGFEGLASYFQE